MFRSILRRAIPLRRRHQLRMLLGGYPLQHRAEYPDLAAVEIGVRPVIFDVGANVGQFLVSALAWWPLATVHSFEPIPAAAGKLEHEFADWGDLHVARVALAAEEGSTELVVREYDQCTSLLELGSKLKEGVYGLDLSPAGTIQVSLERLDRYAQRHGIERIDLLKLDVQGYELEVLKGAGEFLQRIEWIYAEAQFQELYAGGPMFDETARFLHARGFDLVRMAAFRFDEQGKLLECDMLFRRRQGVPG